MADVVVVGKTGQLARCFQDLALRENRNFTFIGRDEMDLSVANSIRTYFSKSKPDIILNLSAYTQVDKAETERELASSVNAIASQELAKSCSKYFYISTDYVYPGTGKHPYTELDRTAPINFYGETKLKGEELARAVNPNTFVVRTSWVYSPYGVNFAKRIAELAKARSELKVVADQIGTPTWAPDLAEVLLKMIDVPSSSVRPGVFNYSNEGACSWFDFARSIVAASGSNCEVVPITSDQYPTAAKRPRYSVLSKRKIKSAYDLEIPDWQASFDVCKKLLFN